MMISAVIFILLGTLNLLAFLISRRKELLIFSVVFLCFGFVSLGAAMILGLLYGADFGVCCIWGFDYGF